MTRKFMRIVTLLLTLSLLAGLLAGCGSTDTSAAESVASEASAAVSEIPEAPAAEEPEPAEEVSDVEAEPEPEPEAEIPQIQYPLVDEPQTLTLWTTFPPPMTNALAGDISQMYSFKVAAEVTGVKLDITSATFETASEQFALNSAAHSWTDLIFGVTSYTNSMEGAVEDGIIVDLTEYLEEFAPDYWKVLQDTPDFKKEVTMDSGMIAAFYGMNDAETLVSGPQIRKDWLDAVNLPIPETLDDLEEVLLAFKNELGIKYPIYASVLSNYLYSGIITCAYGTGAMSSGTYFVDKDGTVHCSWLEDDYKNMLLKLQDWNQKGIVTSDSLTLTGTESAIQGGLTGVWSDNIKTMSTTAEAATNDPNCDIVAMPYPTVEEGGVAYVSTTDYAADPISISTNCADPELASMYVNFFYTPEGQMVCNYGIEGSSYVLDENGEPKYTDLVLNNPDGLDISVAQAIYSAFYVPYVHMTSRTTSAYTDQDEFDASDIWKQNADFSRMYHGDMTVEETEEYTAIMSDLETYVNECAPKFILGEMSFDQWDEFIDQCKTMGVDRTVELKQAAYDRYLQR